MIIEDLTHINWEKGVNKSGTPGCYFKAKINDNYYKLSSFDTVHGFFGHEVLNEVIVSRLGEILGINVLKQHLKKVRISIRGQEYITLACKSDNYLKKGYTRIFFENFYVTYRNQNETVYQFINRYKLDK